MTTLSEENYLKAIYHLGKGGGLAVSTNAIADKVEAKASSVTDMLKKLSEKELVNYVKYQGVNLTENGKKAAASVIRKHRLWEVFLVEKLNFSWDEVHEVAEQLEHIKSDKLVNQLDDLLGNPTHDPHGDPIPDKGKMKSKNNMQTLSDSEEGKTYNITRLKSDDKEFFDFCALYGFRLGNRIIVTNQFKSNKMTQVSIDNNTLLLNEDFTTIIYVTDIDQKQDEPLDENYKLF